MRRRPAQMPAGPPDGGPRPRAKGATRCGLRSAKISSSSFFELSTPAFRAVTSKITKKADVVARPGHSPRRLTMPVTTPCLEEINGGRFQAVVFVATAPSTGFATWPAVPLGVLPASSPAFSTAPAAFEATAVASRAADPSGPSACSASMG